MSMSDQANEFHPSEDITTLSHSWKQKNARQEAEIHRRNRSLLSECQFFLLVHGDMARETVS